MWTGQRAEQVVGTIGIRLTGLFLAATLVIWLVTHPPSVIRYEWLGATIVALLLVALSLVARVPARLGGRLISSVTSLAIGVLAAVVGLLGQHPLSWDPGVIDEVARSAVTGADLTGPQDRYLSRYPNNLGVLALTHGAHELGNAWGADGVSVGIVAGAICIAVSAQLLSVLTRSLAGPGQAVGAQVAFAAVVAASPWTSVPYTDLYAMPLVMGTVVLLSRVPNAKGKPSVLLAVGAAVTGSAAFVLRTIPAALLVAASLTGIVMVLGFAGRTRRLVGVLVLASLTATSVLVLAPALTGAASLGAGPVAERRTYNPDPVLWWAANGMVEKMGTNGHNTYGGYSVDMKEAVTEMSRAEAIDWSARFIEAQLSRRGAGELLMFYATKASWIYGDGMFYAYGEGRDASVENYASTEGAARWVADINNINGRWYLVRANLAEGIWLALLVLAAAGGLLGRYRPELLLVALSVLGVSMFVLAFQGRSRYIFTFAPLVIALAAVGQASLRSRITSVLASRRGSPDVVPYAVGEGPIG